MTTALQQETRKRLRRREFGKADKKRSDFDPYVFTDDKLIPDPRSDDKRRCERCKKVSRIMHWPDRDRVLAPWFRCCGARA